MSRDFYLNFSILGAGAEHMDEATQNWPELQNIFKRKMYKSPRF
jgi:hypothetical protein